LWETAAALRFNAVGWQGSTVDQDGEALIQGVDLDSALPNFKPNLVTLDVEGAELKALRGMERSILKYTPHLAVSIYHRPDDWWVLPIYIRNLIQDNRLEYSLFLRVHHPSAFDVCLYAAPERK
jgi:hypothetical protein